MKNNSEKYRLRALFDKHPNHIHEYIKMLEIDNWCMGDLLDSELKEFRSYINYLEANEKLDIKYFTYMRDLFNYHIQKLEEENE